MNTINLGHRDKLLLWNQIPYDRIIPTMNKATINDPAM